MEARVVCISFADGAAGEELSRLVAERLGFPLINQEIVTRAAREAGVKADAVADVERRRSLLGRLLDGIADSGLTSPYGDLAMAHVEPGPTSDDLRGLIRTAIEERAAEGDVVLAAHAASLALAERADVLRVLVTAPEPTRAARLAEAGGLDEGAARKALRRMDAGRADYLKRFYGVEHEDAELYDLVINTERIQPEQGAELVASTARGGQRAAA
jgi:Cytidylate kinase-like family